MKKNTQKNNPLNKIIVEDTGNIDLDQLTKLLENYSVIEKKTKEISFLPNFYELNNNSKILIALATFKAKAIYFKENNEAKRPKDIISLDIMPSGSVKYCLKKLSDKGIIKREEEGYYLPDYNLIKAKNIINKK